jgi:hypothetical protein
VRGFLGFAITVIVVSLVFAGAWMFVVSPYDDRCDSMGGIIQPEGVFFLHSCWAPDGHRIFPEVTRRATGDVIP